ncbi:Putative sterigmatocystin biosynthesis monooxygenase [Sparassis crispa]|uniref:Sterigmatocystin biosynthesis monooxygenase n=1 Tax=Sparassis crispa TaxID=139825 RepID=A0A401H1S7_9APHY|nr:Putative sterigmatocystin biosynthesis monooxygenase [Sparassis crispa]GBE88396.1 Putative sterigmatocystin biosynthesis monooxygenase [Sparassis crispa]
MGDFAADSTQPPDASQEEPQFKLGTFSIDEYRPIKVVVIGAGFSGIAAGIRFPQRLQNLDLTIYDKNAGVGGTWFSNKYPGLACDIPAHCYQYTFEEKTDWSSFYAPGPEIRSYLEGVVDKYKLTRYIKLRHQVVHARYDEPSGKWYLRIRRPVPCTNSDGEQFEEFEDVADFLFTGIGGLSRWTWPDIEGLKDFKGKLFHSADFEVGNQTWQEAVEDWKDKKVGVIGVGSSALQLVPSIQPRVAKLSNYVRGKTWLSTPFSGAKFAELLKRDPTAENYTFCEEDKETFKDPVYYKQFRHELESDLNSNHSSTLRGTESQLAARTIFADNMRKKLAKKPWIADHLIPDFSVACRRLTPGPGYLEAVSQDNVDFVTTHIKQITPTGIETVDGKHDDLDIIICATGYDTSFQLEFPIIGRDGTDIRDKWSPHPVTYLTLCVDGFPNWFFSLGPNSGVGSGSLLVLIERQVEYAVEVVKKLQREWLKSIEVKREALEDFDEYLEHYFPKTVYSDKCRSWYKMGQEEGRVVGLYPGSCLHAVRAIKHPRWEDYTYEAVNGIKNRLYWLGDGQTYNEKTMTGDMAWYLNEDEVDIPPVPEDY